MSGTLITLEGIEGSGKTTQAGLLAAAMRETGIWPEVLLVREPGGTPLGEAVRRILQHEEIAGGFSPESETLLFAASRAQLVRAVVRPAVERGACVICDRYADSTAAYQGFGRGLSGPLLDSVVAFAVGGMEPGLTFLLDLPVEEGLGRLARRDAERGGRPDRMEREPADFHGRVREGYLELARRNPRRIVVLDGRESTDAVARRVRETVLDRFGEVPGRRKTR